MNAQTQISIGKAIVIFVGLAIVFAVLLVTAISVANTLTQLALVSIGSAILGSGLTFFLIRTTQLDTHK